MTPAGAGRTPRWVLAGLGVLALLYLTACGLLYSYQRSLIYHPTARDPSVPFVALDGGDARVLVSTGGVTGPTSRAVVYFGGNAEDVSGVVGPLARAFPNAAVYGLHYRGYGGSPGTPTEAALVNDGLRLFDRAFAAHPRVTVVGRSLGSGVAVQVAAARPVSRLVLVTPYDSLARVAASRLGLGLFPIGWLLQDTFESWRFAGRVRAPTTLILAADDRLIPGASSRRLAAAFPPGVALTVVIEQADHNTVGSQPAYFAALVGDDPPPTAPETPTP